MNDPFVFTVTPLAEETARPQISRALKERTDRVSRQKYPKLWAVGDYFNSKEKAPEAVLQRRRKLRPLYGVLEWAMGLFLLLPGLMAPRELLIPLLFGAVIFLIGTVSLWISKKHLLILLDLLMSAVLCIGVLGNVEELGRLLPLAIAATTIAVLALISLLRKKKDPFDSSADILLEGRRDKDFDGVRVSFSEEGLAIFKEDKEDERQVFPFSSFELVMETEDLLVPIYSESVLVLQKKDLLHGTLPELREFLGTKTTYEAI